MLNIFIILRSIILVYVVSAMVWSIIVALSTLTSDGSVDGEALPILLYLIAPIGSVITLVIAFVYSLFEKKVLQEIYLANITIASIIMTIVTSSFFEASDYNQVAIYIASSTVVVSIATYIARKRKDNKTITEMAN